MTAELVRPSVQKPRVHAAVARLEIAGQDGVSEPPDDGGVDTRLVERGPDELHRHALSPVRRS